MGCTNSKNNIPVAQNNGIEADLMIIREPRAELSPQQQGVRIQISPEARAALMHEQIQKKREMNEWCRMCERKRPTQNNGIEADLMIIREPRAELSAQQQGDRIQISPEVRAALMHEQMQKKRELEEKMRPKREEQLLLSAVGVGDLSRLQELLERGVNVNAKNNRGWTALLLAYDRGKMEVAKLLIANGADVNVRDKFGKTILYRACTAGRMEIALLLIEKGADVNAITNGGRYRLTALYGACLTGFLEIAKMLIENGADVNAKNVTGQTILQWACTAGNWDVAKLLTENGADVNAKTSKSSKWTALCCACSEGHIAIVKLLIKNGADVNAHNDASDGMTALHGACLKGRWEVAQFLIENGANMYAKDYNGDSPLDKACEQNQLEVVWSLVRQSPGGLENFTQSWSCSPLLSLIPPQ